MLTTLPHLSCPGGKISYYTTKTFSLVISIKAHDSVADNIRPAGSIAAMKLTYANFVLANLRTAESKNL